MSYTNMPRQPRMTQPRGIPQGQRGGHNNQMHAMPGTSPQMYPHQSPQQHPQYMIANMPGTPMYHPGQQIAPAAGYAQVPQYYFMPPTAAAQPGQPGVYYSQMQPPQQVNMTAQQPAPQQTNQGRPPSQPSMGGIAQQPTAAAMAQGYGQAQPAQQQQMQPNPYAQMGQVRMQQPPPPQQPAPLQKRERKPLAIVNPDTHETVNKAQLIAPTESSSNTSTPPPASERKTPDPQPTTTSTTTKHTKETKPEPTPEEIEEKKRQFQAAIAAKLTAPAAPAEPAPTDKVTVNGVTENKSVTKPATDVAKAADTTKPVEKTSPPVVIESKTESVSQSPADSTTTTQSAAVAVPSAVAVEKEAVKEEKTTPTPVQKQETKPAEVSVSVETPAAEPIQTPSTTTSEPTVSNAENTQQPKAENTQPSKQADTDSKAEAMPPVDKTDGSAISKPTTVSASNSDVPAVSTTQTNSAANSAASIKVEKLAMTSPPVSNITEPAAAETPPTSNTTASSDSPQAKDDAQLMPPPPAPSTGSSPSTPVSSSDSNKENQGPTTPVSSSNKPESSQTSSSNSSESSLAPTAPVMKGSKSMVADMSKAAGPTTPYKYKEDPSKPLDPEGKKVYDRDFLMSLQKVDASKLRPEGLPNFSDILLNKPLEMNSQRGAMFGGGGGRRDMNPDFFKPMQSPRQSMTKGGKNQSRDQMRGGPRASQGGQKVINYTREQVQLKRADNAWKPGDKAASSEDKSDDDKTQAELLKVFRGMLNKITPQKFQVILKKILDLPVKSEKDLSGIMNLVFEKAIAEPGFSVTYASLCQNLAKEFKVPSDADPAVEVAFRKLLLIRCQKEFEKSRDDDEEMVTRKAALDEATGDKTKLQAEFDAFETKARRRKLGNIRFIGELFKLQMLVPKIMHDCVISLLKGTDEESLECLCRLLTTIGKELDTEKAKPRTDQYFAEMKKIANNQSHKKVSSRIRFTLQDVIELRECNWKPRRENNNPKTIKEIHAEAALEAHEMQMRVNAQPLPNRGSQSRVHPPNRSNRGEPEGWNQVAIKPQRIDPSKMKLSKTTFGSTDVQLGPGAGFSAGAGWGKGSSGSGKNTPPQQQEDRPNTPTNRFSALMGGDRDGGRDERSRSGQRLPTGRNSMGRGSTAGRGRMNITPRTSMEKDRTSALAAVRQISRPGAGPGSRGASRENSMERRGAGSGLRTPTPTRQAAAGSRATPTPSAVKQLDRSAWGTKMGSVIDELLHNKDVNEAVECIKELAGQNNKELLTESSINHVLERSPQARKTTGQFLAELLKLELLSVNDHLKGLGSVLEFADDLAIDIPNVWQYFGELISPMFIAANIPLDKLLEICNPLLAIGKSATLAAAVLEAASHNIGHIEIGKRWNDSNLKWSSFLSPEENEAEFIKSHKLEYTLSDSVAQNSAATRQTSTEDVTQALDKLLLTDSAPNESVFDWIDGNLSSEKRAEASFIRSLTIAVAKACLKGDEVVEEKFKSRAPLLLKYYDTKPDRELFALTALEELMDQLQHPSKLLSDICYALSEEELISDDSFFAWEKNSKNGIAIKSVTQFFQWLRTSD